MLQLCNSINFCKNEPFVYHFWMVNKGGFLIFQLDFPNLILPCSPGYIGASANSPFQLENFSILRIMYNMSK